MTDDTLHPCARLYQLQLNLEHMSGEQLKLAHGIGPLCDLPALSQAAEQFAMVAIVLQGVANRLKSIRHEISKTLPC